MQARFAMEGPTVLISDFLIFCLFFFTKRCMNENSGILAKLCLHTTDCEGSG